GPEEDQTYLILLDVTGTGTGSVDGDANDNQIVNDEDMAILLAQFGSSYDMARAGDNADFNGDGYVDMADFVILRANWGAGTTPPGASELPNATPEPATMTMLAIGGLVALRRRRRK
ncbi:MAG: PEP-CTERM sorting domain-containing protein, partial [Phycisphaerales bacterium]|nr:PEP-CTERM sorting domain-containing protein [Phycisphaerales bacterium]